MVFALKRCHGDVKCEGYQSLWIRVEGANPHPLYEEKRPDSFELVEETFEEYGWVPEKYARMGPAPEEFQELDF